MKRAAVLLMAGLGLAVAPAGAAPALAQSETGTRLGGRPAQLPDRGTSADRARIWMERYAACIVRRDPKRVGDVLGGPIGEDGPMLKLVRGSGNYDDCLSTGGGAEALSMNRRLLRGALYADRVTSLVNRIEPTLASAGPVAYPPPGQATGQVALVTFGECLVRAAPTAALGFVAARAASEIEKSQLQTLRPHLPGCIAAGQTIQLSASVLEGALAEAIWRMTQARGAANLPEVPQ